MKADEPIKFNPAYDLDRILTSLRMLHLTSLEMNNKVLYINSEFVTPQWVFDLTEPRKEQLESEAAVSMYKDLLIHLSRFIQFVVRYFCILI